MNNNSNDIRPPRLADRLLESFCSYDYLSTALWDLQELFEYHVATKGVAQAKWLYFKESLSIIYHLYFKGQSQYSPNTTAMFKNNLLIALRNFKKHKNYTILNMVGLSSGLTIFLLILLYTTYEFSYDMHHEKADRIYRVYKSVNSLEEIYLDSGTPGLLAEAMVNDYPEIEAAARFSKWRNQLMVANNHSFVEPAIHSVDPSVFQIFSLELLHGSEGEVMAYGPNIAISETVAKKYFGRADVINETMTYNGEIPLTITGVYKDMPANSHFKMDIIVNFKWTSDAFEDNLGNWNNNPYYTYVLLQEAVNVIELEAKLPSIREKYASDPVDGDGQLYTYYLQPLSEVHFADHIHGSMGTIANARRLNTFTAIAFIVLLMAGINYVNLATARAMVRIKETGLRKVMGANRSNILSQFLIESGLLVGFSLLLALIVAYALLPAFSFFVDKPVSFDFLSPVFYMRLVLLGVGITLFSGLYPAMLLSSFHPLHAISNRGRHRNKGYLRNGIVVIQFVLSSVLIVSSIVLQKQLAFIDTADTGYTRDQVIILSTRDDAVDDRLDTYMEEIRKVPGVEAVATSWSLPTNVTSNTVANWSGIDEAKRVQMYMLGVTYHFFDLYQIELVEGRNFNPEIKSDDSAIILNESAVKAFDWKDPIGREMILQNGESGTVIGVVKDFNIKSLKEEIEPLQIVLNPNYATLAVRVSADLPGVMNDIESVYESFDPSYPFEYRYFEDIYERAYADDKKTGQLTLIFSVLAIIIACLGLYGLVSHKVALRIKELGVRKVMGATAINIANLLCKDILVLIGIAFVLSGPIAWFILNGWLENYAYHVDLGASSFIIAFISLITLAGITVGYHTFRAAVSNPVLALRNE